MAASFACSRILSSNPCRNHENQQGGQRVNAQLLSSRSQKIIPTWQAIAVLVLFVIAYFPVWKSLLGTWSNSEDYSHAFLIMPISLYLVWGKKERLREIPVSVSKAGLVLLFFSLLLYLLAFFGKITTVASFSLVVTMVALVWSLFGLEVVKVLLFPLFFLLLMVPIPSQIYSASTIPLQLFVSKASTFIAMALDIPVFREGNVLHLPERTLQVVEACSGLRSIISLFTLSVVFGYISLRSNVNRALLAVAALPVAIFINIVRVLAMLIAFYCFNVDLTSGSLHTYFGLVIFIIALILLYFIAELILIIENKILK